MPNVESRVAELTPTLPRVNLMPPEIAEAARFRRFQFAMGATVVAAVVAVGGLYAQAHSGVSSANDTLAAAQAEHASLQARETSLQGVQSVYNEVAARQAMLQRAMGDEVRWSYYLADLSMKIPQNVWLTSVEATQQTAAAATPAVAAPGSPTVSQLTPSGIGSVTFGGVAFTHDDVATWLESLARERGYINPYFTSASEEFIGPRKVVKFSSSVVLDERAKSGRYAKPAGS